MKKLLLLFVLLTTFSKAQNDTVFVFAYTDMNNNCTYEPTMGEQPIVNYPLTFSYQFTLTGAPITFNNKPTDCNGIVKFPILAGTMLPVTNTLMANSGVGNFSGCYSTTTNYAYNMIHTIPIYCPSGYKQLFITDAQFISPGAYVSSAPNTISYCIGQTVVGVSFYGYNYLDNIMIQPLDLIVAGGSTNSQMLVRNTPCLLGGSTAGGDILYFTNPELNSTGIYTVSFNSPTYSSPSYTLIVDSCSTNTGNVFVDCNANCSKDITEYNCSDEVISSTNGTYSTTVIPDYNGNYSILSPYSATQYSLTVTPNTDFNLACGSPSLSTYYSSSSNFTNFNNILNQTAANNINYSSYVNHPYAGSSAPGGSFKFSSYYYIAQPDYCSLVNNSGTFYIKLDPNVLFVSVDPITPNYTAIYPSPSGDSIVWSIADLRQSAMNLGGHQFVLNLSMKVTAAIGTNYCIGSGVTSQVTETTLTDNNMNNCWVIGGPFDPNFKEVNPKGTGAQGYISASTTELVYTINFQNVGTAPAIDVKIKDVLDNDLDKNTLKVIGSSFPVQTNIDANGLTTFLFDNILLADSTHDEAHSHGFVTYKVNLKPSLAAGTQINNTASIYFDYNAAVVTNSTLNTLQTSTGIQELNYNSFEVYPNPSNGIVTINSTNVISKIIVSNILGEVVKSIAVDSKQVIVDMTDLKSNVYFLHITDIKNQTSIQKIVKE